LSLSRSILQLLNKISELLSIPIEIIVIVFLICILLTSYRTFLNWKTATKNAKFWAKLEICAVAIFLFALWLDHSN